jgi:site-specific DNA-methyltransferase (adenine-specific)
MTLLTGDSALLMPWHGPYDMILADPPYGDTSLVWDRRVLGRAAKARAALKPTGSLWVFGSLRSFLATGAEFRDAGWKYAQEVVWEKPNGTSFHADRFRRVHELIVQFYRDDAPWSGVYNDVPTTPDSRPRRVRQRPGQRAPHMGAIGAASYAREEGGPRLVRSVLYVPRVLGTAIHPTEKPSALLEILIRTSCPPGGLVGDWFAGSGAAGVACRLTGRRYVGCEIDPVMAQKARDRIASVLPLGEGIAP